tara:strand:+ start:607 stop:1821 length:1215 start_codon:yes stop_codon:yes gene_type:complete
MPASSVRKTFKNAGEALGGAKYIDEIAAAVKAGSKTIDDLTVAKALYKAELTDSFRKYPDLKKGFSAVLGSASDIPDDAFIRIMKKFPDGSADEFFEATSDAAKRYKKLIGGADEGADAAGTAGGVSKKADDIDPENVDSLKQLDSLPGPQRKIADEAISKKYAEMSVDVRKMMGDDFLDAGEEGMNTFKKLPKSAQGDLIAANPKLRWKAGETPAGFEWVKGACKNYPKMCVIGATGGLAGAGYASYKIVKAVETAFDDKSAEKRACIATCLPDDFYESKVSGYGTKDYKDLTFRTVEDVKNDSGDDNITKQNTPLCTASMNPPEKCQDMCVKRCDQIHKTFLQRLANTAGGLAKEVVKEASGVAGEGLGGFLDGVFGDGMGIPSAIGIFVFIMIVMVLVSTM